MRAAFFLWGGFCLALAGLNYLDLAAQGFPDGHRTPYQRETYTLRAVLLTACVLQALCFIALSARGAGVSAVFALVLIVAAAGSIAGPLLIVSHCPQMTACVRLYEAVTQKTLDDGGGG